MEQVPPPAAFRGYIPQFKKGIWELSIQALPVCAAKRATSVFGCAGGLGVYSSVALRGPFHLCPPPQGYNIPPRV